MQPSGSLVCCLCILWSCRTKRVGAPRGGCLAAPRMELPGCVALHFQGLNCLHMQWYKNGCMEIRQQCLPNLQREVSGPGSGCIPTPKGNLGKLGYFCFSVLCEAAGCKYKDPSKSPTTKAAHGSQHHLVLSVVGLRVVLAIRWVIFDAFHSSHMYTLCVALTDITSSAPAPPFPACKHAVGCKTHFQYLLTRFHNILPPPKRTQKTVLKRLIREHPVDLTANPPSD